MPTESGVGRADYVLFGKDGKPLAVVEAKRTSVDAHVGKHQAELYADCLEKEYGVRPVIYYTNGYTIQMIDGLGYPERQLYAFHTLEDLELMMQRRKMRTGINDFSVKDEITDRYYQKRAVKAMCEWLNKHHRRGLLVMATGTGKTRTAISLVDVLQRNNWVKNTLFLADRTSLVNQAARNFNKLLPGSPITILSDKTTKPDMKARITFSTFQTMINYVNTDGKPFSVGRFDLIIIDEAHHPVLQKIQNIEQLSSEDIDELERILWQELGTKEDYERYMQREKMTTDTPVAAFIRKIIGVDRQKAIRMFSDFISANDLTAEQEEFINNILNYVCQNGDMDKSLLRDNRVFFQYLTSYFLSIQMRKCF